MKPPTADEQIAFLVKLQRLLDEGAFVASYKFALLLRSPTCASSRQRFRRAAGSATDAIAEKFIRYYWRAGASVPCARRGEDPSAEHRQAGGDRQSSYGRRRAAARWLAGEPYAEDRTHWRRSGARQVARVVR